jgi:hypothetical protein
MAMDVIKGWPLDGALNRNAKPKDGAGIVAGMFVKKDAVGELLKADGVAGEVAYFSLENQSDYSVIGADSLAYVVGNAMMGTDQYDSTKVYGYNTPVMVDNANPGKVTPWVAATPGPGDSPVVATTDGFVTRDGIDYLILLIPDKKL